MKRTRMVMARKWGQGVFIGDVLVMVHHESGARCKLHIEAPESVPICREEFGPADYIAVDGREVRSLLKAGNVDGVLALVADAEACDYDE